MSCNTSKEQSKKLRYKTEFKVLKAFHGDSILVKTIDKDSNEFVILIDGGTAQTFNYSLKSELEELNRIDIIILTHIDSDHIGGLIKLFKSQLFDNISIGEIWFNHPDLIRVENDELISIKQGEELKDLILSKKPETLTEMFSTNYGRFTNSGIEFLPLSPSQEHIDSLYNEWDASKKTVDIKEVNISLEQEEYSKSLIELSKEAYIPGSTFKQDVFNTSSIAFVIKCPDISVLFLADSRPEIIIESLRINGFTESNPLIVDYVKVSHHGSKNNTSPELLSLIKCNHFIISTNGGSSNHIHPSRETIAWIVYNSNRDDKVLNIYFNYAIKDIQDRIGFFINDEDIIEGNWKPDHKNIFSSECIVE